MSLFNASDRAFATAVAALAHTNPFSPERLLREREALGDAFEDAGDFWSADATDPDAAQATERPNVRRLRDRSWALACAARERLGRPTSRASDADVALYEDLALYALFARYERHLYLPSVDESGDRPALAFYRDFRADFHSLLRIDGVRFPGAHAPGHLFALFFQLRRAFHFIFRAIFGRSAAAARLRETVWQSVFTHDLRRYRAGLHERMQDIPTLVMGPTGTGKELVARAIGRSRFIPFDERSRRFIASHTTDYQAVSLAALSPTLIESELFGHRRGAFTGAVDDRAGYLEACGDYGTVFLDEIGELDPGVQVKLLRVLQDRTFQRTGDTAPHMFHGKIVAATHRNLAEAMRQGRFREDLYYRLCADLVQTPSLAERIADDRGELETLTAVLCRRIAGESLSSALASDVMVWIESTLGLDYPWPGNVRELEQCVRNVLVRRRYDPPESASPLRALDQSLLESGLVASEVLDRYCQVVYDRTGSYTETGRRLGLARRTVKERLTQAD